MKERLKQLAKAFDLKFNENWFNYIWISKEENTLLEYMWMCPDPIFVKYGETSYERTKHIENFLDSGDFKECLHRFGGQAINKDTFMKYFPSRISNIENGKVRSSLSKIYKKIIKSMGKSARIAILTKSSIKPEIERLKDFVLFHEWIHILVNENGLKFPHEIKDNWKYNEGLVTYLQEFYAGKLNELEENVRKTRYDFQKQYYIYALKFRQLLKNTNNPRKRKELLRKFIILKRVR